MMSECTLLGWINALHQKAVTLPSLCLLWVLFFFLFIESRVSVDVVLIAHFPVSLSFTMRLAPALLHAHAGGEHGRNKLLQRLGEQILKWI